LTATQGVSTDLSRNLDTESEAAIKQTSNFWKTPDQGASTTLVAALDPALDGKIFKLLKKRTECSLRIGGIVSGQLPIHADSGLRFGSESGQQVVAS